MGQGAGPQGERRDRLTTCVLGVHRGVGRLRVGRLRSLFCCYLFSLFILIKFTATFYSTPFFFAVPYKFDSPWMITLITKLLTRITGLLLLLSLLLIMSTSLDIYAKISVAEAQKWLGNAKVAWDEGRFDADDFLQVITDTKPIDFKTPRKPRTSATSSSASERSEADYDPKKCDARLWLKGGLDAQCSRNKTDGNCLCKKHLKDADSHAGMTEKGFFNSTKPEHKYNDPENALCGWVGQVCSPPKSAKKSAAERKCGSCGETGHNKRSCPHKEPVEDIANEDLLSLPTSKLKKHARSLGVSPTKLDTADDADDVKAAVIELILAAQLKKASKSVTEEETVNEVTPPADGADEEVDDGAGTGLESDLDIDESPDIDESLDINESDDAQFTHFLFEGVKYFRSADNEVFDPEDEEEPETVGKWNGEAIEFTKTGAKGHKFNKAMLSAED